MISLDTETTGIDFASGARPFFVTIYRDDDTQTWWEWDVDPLTRMPRVPEQDVIDICAEIGGNDLALQNSKFDVAALVTVMPNLATCWPWNKTDDTLISGHLLASNQPHDLTSMSMHYLGIDIQPYEDAVHKACVEARRIARAKFPAWMIAKEGLPCMPSVRGSGGSGKGEKDAVWKNDMWLPRAIAKVLGYKVPDDSCKHKWSGWECVVCGGHMWWIVTRDYSNADSFVTAKLWPVMRAEIERRGQWLLYKASLRLMEITFAMEQRGVTINKERLDAAREEYREASAALEKEMLAIARKYVVPSADLFGEQPYDLRLPKSGRNKSLDTFVFDVLKLEKLYDPKNQTGGPVMDSKIAIPHWKATLPPESDGYRFINALDSKRRRDTALTYLDGYERLWTPHDVDGWYVLYPSFNPTGAQSTTRLSSSNPNGQNVSKKEGFNLRQCFGPAPGREWWCKDAANIELRIPAYESGERELIDLFERANEPPYYGSEHLLNFSTVYPEIWARELGSRCDDPKCCDGKTVDESRIGPHCKKQYESTEYRWCKGGDFAVGYQAGDATADAAFHRPGARRMLLSRFARKEALNARFVADANKFGYVLTMPDKTCGNIGYPLWTTRNEWGRVKPTEPLNYHVQGTAGWWMRKALARVYDFYTALNRGEPFAGRVWRGGHYIALTVHDELVSDMPSGKGRGKFPYSYNLPIVREVKRLMELGGDDIGVPTPVNIEYCEHDWASGKVIKDLGGDGAKRRQHTERVKALPVPRR